VQLEAARENRPGHPDAQAGDLDVHTVRVAVMAPKWAKRWRDMRIRAAFEAVAARGRFGESESQIRALRAYVESKSDGFLRFS
jgi:hypothetical protein